MGGNALKEFNPIRLNSQEFNQVSTDVGELLNHEFPKLHWKPIKSYPAKSSHGDLDILYARGSDYDFVSDFINSFKPLAYKKNGDVLSFVYPVSQGNFQIDLISVPRESFDFAYNYFNYNDLANIMGRVYFKAGFKLGHTGLKYVLRDKIKTNNVIDEIIVTTNWQEAMDFMDYSSYFNHKFNTLEDIFKFAVSSKYSNKQIYLLENRNHISRTRDKKRPTYTAFLKWLDDSTNQCHDYPWTDTDKFIFLDQAFKKWPAFTALYDNALKKHWDKIFIREKFNGDIISELTGLTEKELGRFIQQIKLLFGVGFDSYIFNSHPNDIKLFIKNFHEFTRNGL